MRQSSQVLRNTSLDSEENGDIIVLEKFKVNACHTITVCHSHPALIIATSSSFELVFALVHCNVLSPPHRPAAIFLGFLDFHVSMLLQSPVRAIAMDSWGELLSSVHYASMVNRWPSVQILKCPENRWDALMAANENPGVHKQNVNERSKFSAILCLRVCSVHSYISYFRVIKWWNSNNCTDEIAG